jgi:hypothetical protein
VFADVSRTRGNSEELSGTLQQKQRTKVCFLAKRPPIVLEDSQSRVSRRTAPCSLLQFSPVVPTDSSALTGRESCSALAANERFGDKKREYCPAFSPSGSTVEKTLLQKKSKSKKTQ